MNPLDGLRATVVIRAKDPVVRDHRVHGVRVLPGVALLDLVFRSLRGKGVDTAGVEARRVVFRRPVTCRPGQDVEVRIAVAYSGGRYTVTGTGRTISDGDRPSDPFEIFEGELLVGGPPDDGGSLDLAAFRARTTVTGTMADLYRMLRGTGIEHGDFMRGEGTLFRSGDEVLAQLWLGRAAAAYSGYFHLHPGLLDAATIVPTHFATTTSDVAGQPFIPMVIESFRAFEPTGTRVSVLATRPASAGDGGDLTTCDLDFFADDGRRFMWIHGLTSKRIRDADLITGLIDRTVSGTGTGDAAGPEVRLGSDPSPEPGETLSAEELIRTLVARRLGEKTELITDDLGFYQLGMDSTGMLAVASDLERALGVDLYPTVLFEYPDVRSLAAYLRTTPPLAERITSVTAPIPHGHADPTDLTDPADSATEVLAFREVWCQAPGPAKPEVGPEGGLLLIDPAGRWDPASTPRGTIVVRWAAELEEVPPTRVIWLATGHG